MACVGRGEPFRSMGYPMEHGDITQTIIGCAFKVYNQMGYGFLESVYEKCLAIELERAGLRVAAQTPITVYYEGIDVGHFVADLLVEDFVIVELKSVRTINTAHEVQLVNYLTATGKPVGLLLNFGEKKVEIVRKVRTLPRPIEPDQPDPVHPV
jgi:GxxExxY protein